MAPAAHLGSGIAQAALCPEPAVQAVPLRLVALQRGAGIDQPIMRTVAAEVARGRWVHIFPEGKVNYTGLLGPLRWGVGKLVCDARARSSRWAGRRARGWCWAGTMGAWAQQDGGTSTAALCQGVSSQPEVRKLACCGAVHQLAVEVWERPGAPDASPAARIAPIPGPL